MRSADRADAASDVCVTEHPSERALLLPCGTDLLVAILALPRAPRARGVLIVVGGPQYRVGSHRQFVLLARHLARAGIACLRFDVRGMGDSPGAPHSFERLDADLHCAIDAFLAHTPGLQEVVLWGLCDGASAALLSGTRHPCVRGLVLLNPWVRSEATAAQARLEHYYVERLLSGALWRKVLRGGFDWRGSLAALAGTVRSARAAARPPQAPPFQVRMAEGLLGFDGAVLLILSGNDLTGQEFVRLTRSDPRWREAMARPRLARVDLPEADHTFSRAAWQEQVEQATLAWLDTW